MRINPVVPVVKSVNDASTKTDKRITQKADSAGVVVELSTYRSKPGTPRMTKERVLEYLKWFEEL